MQTTCIEQIKITNLTIRLLLFIILISFSSSTLNKKNANSNLDADIILEKLISGDLSLIEDKNNFLFLSSILEDEKNEIIYKKSFKGFNNTISYKLIIEINKNVITTNYEIMGMKEINEILKIFIKNISDIFELDINNNFFNEVIFNLLGIYSNYKNNHLNYENFNEKIIPIIYKIIDKELYEYNNNNKPSTNDFLTECISIFTYFTKNNNFFLNLEKNNKLKELFINIIDRYINFLTKAKYSSNYYEVLINNFFDFYVLEDIKSNDYSKKVYFEILDCFLKKFEEILKTENITYISLYVIKYFIDKIFKNLFYLENIIDLDKLINIIRKIIDIELDKNKTNMLSIYIIEFYIEYIANISNKKNEKILQIIEIFEANIEKFILLYKSFEISGQNNLFHYISYKNINKYLYCSNINFENDKFNNPNLIKKIKNTFYEYITKIFMFELEKISYNAKELHNNHIICEFLSKSPKILKKYSLKNIINKKVIKLLEKFYESPEDQEFLKKRCISNKDKNLLEFAFVYDLIDMDEIENRNLLQNFNKFF